MLEKLTDCLVHGQSLDPEQIRLAVAQLVAETVAPEVKATFLIALADKGETADEIAVFAREMRDRSVPVPVATETLAGEILDVCGTGGDRLNTFNISTTVALIAAAAGITVAKHGNRAITSQAGSADVLEALGIRTELTPEEAARWLREHQFAFFFAPNYHPAFRHIAPARKLCAAQSRRTIFNFLGPLLNPARPTAQLVGVPQSALCEPVGRVLQMLGVRRGMAVCGSVPAAHQSSLLLPHRPPASLDELSTLGENTVAEFYQERGFHVSVLSHESFPLQPADLAALSGGNAKVNAGILRGILSGDDRGPKRDAVLLNAGAAFFVAGKSASIMDGWEMAAAIIDQGAAARKLEELIAISA